jgi:hypothetical protein
VTLIIGLAGTQRWSLRPEIDIATDLSGELQILYYHRPSPFILLSCFCSFILLVLIIQSCPGNVSTHPLFNIRLISSIYLAAYVDTNLLGGAEPKLVEAAILSQNDAGVWAISQGYQAKVCL